MSKRFVTVMFLLLLGLCLSMSSLRAQITDSLSTRRLSSFEGYNFLVGYMQNENFIQSSGIRLRLIITSSQRANVTVKYPNGSPTPYTINANSSVNIVVPSNFEMRESEKRSRSLIEVNSDVPVAVYAMSSQFTSSDSYAIIPISNWNTAYTVLSMPNDSYNAGTDSLGVPPSEIRQSEFLIMAAYDNTIVDYKTTAPTQAGRAAGIWHSDTLQRGECFFIKSAPIRPLTGDLTGSFVRSNRPIAVLSGHARTSVPQALVNSVDSKDHLAEWLMPDQCLGTEYISVPFYTDARLPIGDVIRIVATQPNTRVSLKTERDDLSYTLVNAGDVRTVPGMSSPGWFTSDKPVSIGQYMLTGSVGGSSGYDPALAIVPPTDKFISRSVFQTPFNLTEPAFVAQYQKHFVNIVCDSVARYSMTLDGVNIGQKIAPDLLINKFRSSPFFWIQVELKPGLHVVACDTGGFSGTLYGMGYTDSYAHTLGFSTLVGIKDIDAPFFTVSESCGTISGSVNEVINAVSTSLAYVLAETDSTVNYSFSSDDIRIDANRINFKAKPIDLFKDAQIFITVRDKAGNGRRYRHYYRAPRFTQSTSLQFTAKTENDSLCQRLFIQCPLPTDSLLIQNVRLAANSPYLKINAPSSLPIKVSPKGGVDFYVCFTPRGTSGLKFVDTVLVDIGCGMIIRVPIKATTPTSLLLVTDLDFGDVRVGDTLCKSQLVINNGSRVATITDAQLSFPTPAFTDNHASLLPRTLKPGDTLTLRVCFSPTDTFDLKRSMIFENSLAVDVIGDVRGHGVRAVPIAPDVDFSAHRISTYIDSGVVIRNSGNTDIELKYRQQNGNSAVFLHSSVVGKSLRIAKNDSLTVLVRFYPLSVGSYQSQLVFDTDLKDKIPVVVNLKGSGTVPIDSVRAMNFDTITVNTTKSLRQACVYSKGTEPLTIDAIRVSGADAASFSFVQQQLGAQQIISGDSLGFDVVFKPKRLGRHDVQLVVTHDAERAYIRRQSTVNIVGWARDTVPKDTTKQDTTKRDTLAPLLRLIIPQRVYACQSIPYTVILRNRDTVNLSISSFEMRNDISSDSVLRVPTPRLLRASKSDTVSGVLRAPLKDGTMRVSVRVGKWSLDTSVHVVTYKSTSSANLEKAVFAKAKDSVLVTFAGSFASSSQVAEIFEFRSSIPDEMFRIVRSTSTMTFEPARAEIPVTIDQRDKEIVIRCMKAFAPDTTLKWKVQIPCVALFSNLSYVSVTTHFNSGPCYEATDEYSYASVERVCAEDVRHFEMSGFEIKQVFPQPAGDKLHLKLKVFSESQSLNISLVDNIGRKFPLASNLLLRKDDNSLILDLYSIPSGFYRLELQTRDDVKQLPIMLTK